MVTGIQTAITLGGVSAFGVAAGVAAGNGVSDKGRLGFQLENTGVEAALGLVGLVGAAGIGIINTMPGGHQSGLLALAGVISAFAGAALLTDSIVRAVKGD